ncbi:hypothetical protein BHM03_00035408 [Ensete ventricosum]|nr:hypothetical protein BHM03_00035408 [Ensete ventricosum]
MPPQDQAPVKDADLEPMPMNLKERDRYVVNHDEGLTVVDFDGYVILAEKKPLYCQSWQEQWQGRKKGQRQWTIDDCFRKLQGMQQQGRKKGQQSGSRLEATARRQGYRAKVNRRQWLGWQRKRIAAATATWAAGADEGGGNNEMREKKECVVGAGDVGSRRRPKCQGKVEGATTDGEEEGEFVDRVQRRGYAGG